jgi:hypothetical protein
VGGFTAPLVVAAVLAAQPGVRQRDDPGAGRDRWPVGDSTGTAEARLAAALARGYSQEFDLAALLDLAD